MDLINREISWLSFNERVLQEALDPRNPIIERMRFLGIYSNNLDEFFRVRVANVRRMILVKNNDVQGFKGNAQDLYNHIRSIVVNQQRQFQLAYNKILKELSGNNIYHVSEKDLTQEQEQELRLYFKMSLRHAIVPIMLNKNTPFPRLKDSGIYLAVRIQETKKKKPKFALIKIPSDINRFYRIKEGNLEKIILLDDIIRLNLESVFSIFTFESISAHTFKFSRDAELDLDDDISVSFKDKIEKSIKRRKKGDPVRFVYDENMPADLLEYLLHALDLKFGVNTISGGKYHNFKDFMRFPDFGRPEFVYKPLPPLNHPRFDHQKSLIKAILEKDVLLHYPYQRFDYIVDLLREAAIDPKVKSIRINVYRVADNSQIMNALINAVSNGKKVIVFLELQARFDEENNLFWSNKLKENGAIVLHGSPGLKVHSKLMQIERVTNRKVQLISHIGTGNFNERTAKVYEDLSLLTAHPEISREVQKVFNLLENNLKRGIFNTLIVSPFNARRRICQFIDQEIANAKAGKKAYIRMKLNNMTDAQMIRKLYDASDAGVKIDLVLRGICCLVPNQEGKSRNIRVVSIVGRFLEHARVMNFHNDGDPLYFISSADWMERNLDKRIEVGCPIYDKEIQEELDLLFSYQLKDNTKARMIGVYQKNKYKKTKDAPFHALTELYRYYFTLASSNESTINP